MKWGMEWDRMKQKRKKSSTRLSASPSRLTTITTRKVRVKTHAGIMPPLPKKQPLSLLPNGTARNMQTSWMLSLPKSGCISVSWPVARHGVTSDVPAIRPAWSSPKWPVPSQMCRTAGDTRIRKSTTIPTIKRCQPKTLTTTNCSGQNKDFVRKPILPEEYIILTTE